MIHNIEKLKRSKKNLKNLIYRQHKQGHTKKAFKLAVQREELQYSISEFTQHI
jgi:hypothetical protein